MGGLGRAAAVDAAAATAVATAAAVAVDVSCCCCCLASHSCGVCYAMCVSAECLLSFYVLVRLPAGGKQEQGQHQHEGQILIAYKHVCTWHWATFALHSLHTVLLGLRQPFSAAESASIGMHSSSLT